ncbi:type VII secretion integral membrane protein EccD [Rhodococcus sp. WS4]|nr:type VII secretion integral membrane protein EccD [Rhodococcus sp. WS4]
MALTDTHTRVTIQVPRHAVDVTITKDTAIASLVGEIVTFVREALADDEETNAWLSDLSAVWQLATTTGRHFDGADTPFTAKIMDGDVLVLVNSQQRENYPPLIDDVAESIAYYQRQHFGQWTSDHARALGSVAGPVAALVVVLALGYGAWTGLFDGAVQAALTGAFALTSVVAIALAAAGLKSAEEDSTKQLAGSTILVGYLCATGAAMLVIPGEVGIYNVLLAGVTVATLTIIVMISVGYPEKLNYAAATAGSLFVFASTLGILTDADPLIFSVYLAGAALGFLLLSSRLALVLARIPMPFVPTVGETFVHDDSDDITTVEAGSGAAAIAAIINQEKQVVTAYHCIVGLTWGGLTAILISAFVAGQSLNHHTDAAFAFYVVVSLAMIFRGKSFEDAIVQRSWLAGSLATFSLFLIGTALAGGNAHIVIVGAVALAVGVAIAGYFAVRGKVINSPVVMKMFELFEYLCFAAPVVLIVIVIDGFQKARGR